jgi:hypothetical protein
MQLGNWDTFTAAEMLITVFWTWCHALLQVVYNVLEEHTAFIFEVEVSHIGMSVGYIEEGDQYEWD